MPFSGIRCEFLYFISQHFYRCEFLRYFRVSHENMRASRASKNLLRKVSPNGGNFRGNSSVVERHLAKVDVAGSTPVFRSSKLLLVVGDILLLLRKKLPNSNAVQRERCEFLLSTAVRFFAQAKMRALRANKNSLQKVSPAAKLSAEIAQW